MTDGPRRPGQKSRHGAWRRFRRPRDGPGRHPTAAAQVDPISTGPDYATDLRRAELFRPLLEDGLAGSNVEASLRFPLATEAVSTVLLGMSSLDQLELAAAAVEKGPLTDDALDRLRGIWNQMAE